MIDRYPGVPGCRLDTREDDGMTGPAVDLGGRAGDYTLWVRESGTGDGKSVCVDLSTDNLRALRDGATRLLVEDGIETMTSVSVPRNV